MKAQCLVCNDILESTNGIPDFCKCKRSYLDVGPDHYRGGGYLKYIKEKDDKQ